MICADVYSLHDNIIIGKNELSGSIPTEYIDMTPSPGQKGNPACRIFRNAVKKIRLDWIVDAFPSSSTQFLSSMQILSLREY